MDNDIHESVEVKEKIAWKDLFLDQAKIVKNGIRTGYSKLSIEFETLHSLIPDSLLDNQIRMVWDDFDLKTTPNDTKKWLELYKDIWNWAWNHGLVLTPEQFDPLQTEVNNVIDMIEGWDPDGLKIWAKSALNQNSF